MQNEQLFKQHMGRFAEITRQEPSDFFLQDIWQALKPYNDEQCVKAFDYVRLNDKLLKFPSPGTFVEAMKDEENVKIGDEWSNLYRYYMQTTSWNEAGLTPEAKQVFSQLGGLATMRSLNQGQMVWFEKDFKAKLKELTENGGGRMIIEGKVTNRLGMVQVNQLVSKVLKRSSTNEQ